MRAQMRKSRAFLALSAAGIVLTCAFLLFPVYWIVMTALSEPSELRRLPPVENRIISHHEQLYRDSLRQQAADGGDVDLFE